MFLIELVKRQLRMTDDRIEETGLQLKEYDDLPGTLVMRSRKNTDTDYYVQVWHDGMKTLHPLGKADSKYVIAYKKKRFLQAKLKVLQADKRISEKFLKKYKGYSPEAIVVNLPRAYKGLSLNSYESVGTRKLPFPYGHVPDKIYNDPKFKELLEWQAMDYKRNPAKLPDNPNIARDGLPMRSKGECMWYDDILFEGLPCWVDPEIEMKGKSGQWHKLYPDFVFKCFDGTYIYVEHFGKLDDDDYAARKMRKIQEYLDCGIVLGDNLIVTSDNADHCTNELMILEALDKIKKRMFA